MMDVAVSSAASLTDTELELTSSKAAASSGTMKGSDGGPTISARARKKNKHPSLASGEAVLPFLVSETTVDAISVVSKVRSVDPIDARLTEDAILRIPPPGFIPFSFPKTAPIPFGIKICSILSRINDFFNTVITPKDLVSIARSAAALPLSIDVDAALGVAIPVGLEKRGAGPPKI
jgi:hypothetical protein